MIEGICSDKGIRKGTVMTKKKDGSVEEKKRTSLEGKIAGLCEGGYLTASNANTLHEHRFLGNDALHKLDQPSKEELALAMDIMEHTLEALYEMPDKADALRDRKAARKNRPPLPVPPPPKCPSPG